MAEGRTVTISIPGRPALLNAERSNHWREHRERTRAVRLEAGLRLAREGRKVMAMVKVDVWSTYASRQLADTAACLPAVKAVIDGAVDAGLLTNDTPDIVRHVAFWAPQHNPVTGDLLIVTFEEIDETSPWYGRPPDVGL